MDYAEYTKNRYETFALILGIASIGFLFTGLFFLPFILGPIAIILAFLSRGKQKTLSSKSLLAAILGSTALILVIATCVICLLLYVYNPTIHLYVNNTLTSYLGIDFSECVTLMDVYRTAMTAQ